MSGYKTAMRPNNAPCRGRREPVLNAIRILVIPSYRLDDCGADRLLLISQMLTEQSPGHFGTRHFYRKTKLFGRFLSFDVTREKPERQCN